MGMTGAGTGSLQRGIDRLLGVVARLRAENGCPWDREQTLASLKACLIEETYELLDAIEADDPARHREELGDVLLQVVMQCRIREEQGAFGFEEVADALAAKLIRRHPHVFADAQASDSAQVLRNWERIKAGEKSGAGQSLFAGLPQSLPALQKAQRVQGRAARVGFDWERIGDVAEKVREELGEVEEAVAKSSADAVREEIGDLLFAVVNLARFAGVDAEEALRATVGKFTRRFGRMEERLRKEGRALPDCSLEEMDAHWTAVKADGG